MTLSWAKALGLEDHGSPKATVGGGAGSQASVTSAERPEQAATIPLPLHWPDDIVRTTVAPVY